MPPPLSIPPQPVESGPSGDLNGIIPLDPIFVGNAYRGQQAIYHAVDLLDASRADEAYAYYESIRREEPELEPFIQGSTVACELLSGHYAEALCETAARIRQYAPTTAASDYDPDLLNLSLASAGLGRVYPGQWDFCVRLLQNSRWTPEPLKLTAQSDDPRQVMALSSLALAMSHGSPPQAYFELALKLEPKSELAARLAVEYDGMQGRYSDLRRIAAAEVPLLPDGPTKDFIKDRLAADAGLPDRPRPRHEKQAPPPP